eukprot:2220702-Amphidinium_carterae.1
MTTSQPSMPCLAQVRKVQRDERQPHDHQDKHKEGMNNDNGVLVEYMKNKIYMIMTFIFRIKSQPVSLERCNHETTPMPRHFG